MPKIEAKVQSVLQVLRYFRATLILVLITLVLVLVMALFGIRAGEVQGGEVGIVLNQFTGEVEVITSAGTHIYNGIKKSFSVIDKTIQTLEMVAETGRGAVHGNDELRVKTVDGNNVALDLTVIYQIDATPAQIIEVVSDSGPGNAYKDKWTRDYARSICRNAFGELTTEEFYDAVKRNKQAMAAKDELNRRLKPHGIIITNVIAEKFRFHPDYEKKIVEKKIADQSVEQEISLARAALQSMERMRVEAEKAKQVALTTFAGQMRELIVTAKAEAEKIRQGADAYAIETSIGADAEFYQKQKQSEAIMATKAAEAQGIVKMAEALAGEGGLNIVKMEYASKLKDMAITGQPFTIQSTTERFEHHEDGGSKLVEPAGARSAAAQEGSP